MIGRLRQHGVWIRTGRARNSLSAMVPTGWHEIGKDPRHHRQRTRTMPSETRTLDQPTAKLIACAVIVVCLALGAIGLLLPLVPGLLFLAIAAAVAAKLSPAFASTLRRNATLAGYLDRTDGFLELPFGQKVQVACLLCVRMLVDGVALLVTAVTKLVRAAERA
jgi:uncharacterized membrane protein YbaN (DUF454 family)